MKILLVNTSQRTGGAAVACSRLLEALNKLGVKAKMLVRDKQTDNLSVIAVSGRRRMKLRFLWERFVIWLNNRFSRKNLFAVSIANTGCDITRLPEFEEADVIHLHWVNQGMLSLNDIRKVLSSGKPVVWTMHDMWPCTAICHHARTCANYHMACGNCPFVHDGTGRKDLSYRVFRKKQQAYQAGKAHFVACSHWLEEQAKQSALLVGQRVLSIPNPINTVLFAPRGKNEARDRLHLPQDRRLMLFGAVKITDKRKGIDYLVEACKLLAGQHPEWKNQLGLVVLGQQSEQLAGLLPFDVYPLAYVSDEHRLADVYNAVDLFVTPSLEENLPNTIMEAMSCGTPCVGFHIGGIPEMIDHRQNGYVAEYRSAEDFACGIHWTLAESDYQTLARNARHKVIEHYSEQAVGQRYIALYTEALSARNQSKVP